MSTWVKVVKAETKYKQAGIQGPTRPWGEGRRLKTDSSDYHGIDILMEHAGNVEFTRRIQVGGSFRLKKKRKKENVS